MPFLELQLSSVDIKITAQYVLQYYILSMRCSGAGFYKQATRSNRHIWKKKGDMW